MGYLLRLRRENIFLIRSTGLIGYKGLSMTRNARHSLILILLTDLSVDVHGKLVHVMTIGSSSAKIILQEW